MVSFGDVFKSYTQGVGELIKDEIDTETEIKDILEGEGGFSKDKRKKAGKTFIDHKKKKQAIAEKTNKKVKDLAQELPPLPPPISPIEVYLNGGDLKVDKTNKTKIVKPPKKVSTTKGRDTKLPNIGKKSKDKSAKDKNYKTQAGDVTANSEDPSQKPTSLAIIALVAGAIGLGIYFYLR